MTGRTLGHYRIEKKLGQGGMGEVYRAVDTRLDRTVAVKILSAAGADLRARFEREARAVSSLNHPNICTLHDVGREDGVDFLVMELVEGETLARRLESGPMPPAAALRTAIEIAGVLDHAHRAGITHRDLKPATVMLTRTGSKLLDFGLAKAAPGASAAATTQTFLTAEGVVAGTVPYMAPEQLHGKDADARSDIFAFGAVLYEMLTGQRAFPGDSAASVIAGILEKQPARAVSPPAMNRVIERCLAKDPDDRWQSARDLMHELKWLAESKEETVAPAATAPRRTWWIVAPLLALAAVGWMVALRKSSPEGPRFDFSILPPQDASFVFRINAGGLAISPDGRKLAFVAAREGNVQLYVRDLDSLEARVVQGSDGASLPFWSPDSRLIGFFGQGKLKKVDPAADSPPEILCDAEEGRGATWNADGVMLFSHGGQGSKLWRVSDKGGTPEPVTTVNDKKGELAHRLPHFLPDGRRFLFTIRPPQVGGIVLGSLDRPDQHIRLVQADSNSSYVPPKGSSPAYLVYARGRSVFAQPFYPDEARLATPAVSLTSQVGYLGALGAANFSVSREGTLVFGSTGNPVTQLRWFLRDGRAMETVGTPASIVSLRMSPDQKSVALWIDDPGGSQDIWLMEPARGVFNRVTTDPGNEVMPIWSPDSKTILYSSTARGGPNLTFLRADGSGKPHMPLPFAETRIASDWSAKGDWVLFSVLSPVSKYDLWAMPKPPNGKPQLFLQTEFNEAEAVLSPDGRWVAYNSDESGGPEIYLRQFPSAAGKIRISNSGGTQASWRRDGRELFYLSPDDHMTAVAIQLGERLEAGVPRPLFAVRTPPFGSTLTGHHYAATADGQRFLVNTLAEKDASAALTVITDWRRRLNSEER